eukprot:TRINITY_DN1878_c2_g2_i1.p1 TRINITY_DN1878_c2_g2~~TRINITY_DN1878_c2_g2_i1.p1  ORF type:complete len:583 (+),score=98.45 TRINITY_DN1878_c2_g2_i1:48-1796(+)
MDMSNPFGGRTIHLVSDLSLHEQLYLYEKTRILKGGDPKSTQLLTGCTDTKKDLADKTKGSEAAMYLMFAEDSTRTKDSFRNAAQYHGMKVTDFTDAKDVFGKETVTDVVKMLNSYNTNRSLFVIRSPMEGVCRWLESAVGSKSDTNPSFINAGDGRHTHPTLEFVDIFSLLEMKNFDRSTIHLALVGDLLNGRTAHSKVDGLKIFEDVTIDLVAHKDVAYPIEYRAKMQTNGFKVREFSSIEEYLSQSSVADVWSYSRVQTSRMSEEAKANEDAIRRAVTFKSAWRSKLPEGCRFLQTLPRDRVKPLIPFDLDSDSLAAWEVASGNGYWVRIVLLGMLLGTLGKDFVPQSPKPSELVPPINPTAPDFVRSAPAEQGEKDAAALLPLDNGVFIDEISQGAEPGVCWHTIESIRMVMRWTGLGSQGVYLSENDRHKAVMSLPGTTKADLGENDLKLLAAIAPGSKVNFIENGKISSRYELSTPPRIYGIPNVGCNNVNCVSHKLSNQPDVKPDLVRVPFYVSTALKCKLPAYEIRLSGQMAGLSLDGGSDTEDMSSADVGSGHHLFVCRYCMWPHFYSDIWIK